MALVVNATPLDPACNSYVSIAGAGDYVATRVPNAEIGTAWEALTDDQKGLYLVNATRSLDSFVDWIGDRYTRDQGVKWPRVNAYVDGWLIDNITFPRPVIEATVEMALWSMTNDGAVAISTNTQFDSIKVGPIDIDFNEGAGTPAQIFFPESVAILLRDYGLVTQPDLPSTNTLRVVRLVRA